MQGGWTNDQQHAIKQVREWYSSGSKRPFYITGYAGTGKTSLAKHFAQGISDVAFGAFTGKAASVLRKKGCPGATTIHSLIYRHAGKENAKKMEELRTLLSEATDADMDDGKTETWDRELIALEKRSKERFVLQEDPEIQEMKLVVIDEYSMVDTFIERDLLKWGVPVLFIGDPGQLPPVNGKAASDYRKPDFHLDEIHRQAKDSPILALATDARCGRQLHIGDYTTQEGNVAVMSKDSFDWDHAVASSQVICGRNDTRARLNAAIRRRRNFEKLYPEAGDKLICLKNDHELEILNGVTCTMLRSEKKKYVLDTVIDYEGNRLELFLDPGHFEKNYGKRMSYPSYDTVSHFDYGYAITCHKSQGSQWYDVVLCDDGLMSHDQEFRKKWLYTAITRSERDLRVYVP
jgi:exodeoxyribonuclease-5